MNTPVRVVSLDATPNAQAGADEFASGAHINVYVLASTDAEARDRANSEVNAAGWSVSSAGEVILVTAASFAPNSEGLAYYQQCLADGIVIAIHTWRQEH